MSPARVGMSGRTRRGALLLMLATIIVAFMNLYTPRLPVTVEEQETSVEQETLAKQPQTCPTVIITFVKDTEVPNKRWYSSMRHVNDCVIRIIHTHDVSTRNLTQLDANRFFYRGPYSQKGRVSTSAAKLSDLVNKSEAIMFLDGDEVVRHESGSLLTPADLAAIAKESRSWSTGRAKYKGRNIASCRVNNNITRNVEPRLSYPVERTPRTKALFATRDFDSTDHGNHRGRTISDPDCATNTMSCFNTTNYTLYHFSGDLAFGEWIALMQSRSLSRSFTPTSNCATGGAQYCRAAKAIWSGDVATMESLYRTLACVPPNTTADRFNYYPR